MHILTHGYFDRIQLFNIFLSYSAGFATYITLGFMNSYPMNICESNKAVSLEVLNFMQNVADIKEESITDYLVWKWRELDKRFNYLSMKTFNHAVENVTTGADFDLELWLVGSKTHVSLAVQAKKFIKPYDSYVKRLNYPNGTKHQLNTLLAYAATHNRLPFYFIYSVPGPQTTTMCRLPSHSDCGVFMADANVMKQFADGKHGKRASRDDLLSKSNPFHCMFCCPLGPRGSYFNEYFRHAAQDATARSNEVIPEYVRSLLAEDSDRLRDDGQARTLNNEEWSRFRAVGVYDLRNDA